MNIKVVNQKNLSPELGWLDIRVDRASVLGNPFELDKLTTRDAVCDAYHEWLWANIKLVAQGKGSERVSLIPWFFKHVIADKFKNPTAQQVVDELARLLKLLNQGKKLRLLCWCPEGKRCHTLSIVKCLVWLNKSKEEQNAYSK